MTTTAAQAAAHAALMQITGGDFRNLATPAQVAEVTGTTAPAAAAALESLTEMGAVKAHRLGNASTSRTGAFRSAYSIRLRRI